MRPNATIKLGYFPLPSLEAERIRRFLSFPASPFAALDPCIGEGGAFAKIADRDNAIRYGIELDAFRAEQASAVAQQVIRGNALDAHCAVESLSLLYLNPPYQFECGEGRNARMEQVFLEHCYRWLKPGGVLILVVPGDKLHVCDQVLAVHFKEKRVYRLTAPDSVKYKQVVLFGLRRTRRERDRLQDFEVSQARNRIHGMSRGWESLPTLADVPAAVYPIPDGGPATLVNHGLPLDEIEDLLSKSPAYRQACRVLFPPPQSVKGRPLTPLHAGHAAICAVSGMLNGIFGAGEDRHVAAWSSTKAVTVSTEEAADGTIVRTEREHFVQELTLIFASGQTAILR
jgi:SAM-dependent methyltransferase